MPEVAQEERPGTEEVYKQALDLSESSLLRIQELEAENAVLLEKVAAAENSSHKEASAPVAPTEAALEDALGALEVAGLVEASQREKLASAFRKHPDQILSSVRIVAGHYNDLQNTRPPAHVEGRVVTKSASADSDTSPAGDPDGWDDVIREGA